MDVEAGGATVGLFLNCRLLHRLSRGFRFDLGRATEVGITAAEVARQCILDLVLVADDAGDVCVLVADRVPY